MTNDTRKFQVPKYEKLKDPPMPKDHHKFVKAHPSGQDVRVEKWTKPAPEEANPVFPKKDQ